MKAWRAGLPVSIGLTLLIGLLSLLNPRLSRAEPQAQLVTVEHTTLEDFNRGIFDRTGMTRLADGEVTLLRIGIAGEWITTTNSTGLIPRFEHASVASNNFLYVFGGRTGSGSLRSIQYAAINTATHDLGNWSTAAATLGTALYTHTTGTYTGVKGIAAAVLHGRIYLLGGENGDQSFYYNTVSFGKLNPDTGSVSALTATAPLPKALSNGQVAVLNNRLYFFGGRGAPNNQGNDEVYYASPDPTTGVITGWHTATARLPYKTYGHMSVATVNGRLYTLAGANVSTIGGIRADINVATPLTDTGDITAWLPINSLPRNIYGGAITSFGGQLYVIGGAWDNINQPVNEVLAALEDTSGNTLTWATTSYITPVRLLHSAVVNADGWIYVVGGSQGQNQPIQQYIVNAGATTGQSGSAYVDQGYYLGDVFDIGRDYPLRALQWTIDLPDPAVVTASLRYRYQLAGSSAFSAWTDWYPAQATAGVQTTTLPLTMTARYLQYQVAFAQTNPQLSPSLQRVSLTYETPDPPKLSKAAEPAHNTVVAAGERVTYTIGISNPTGQTFAQSFITDVVPDHLTYVPGSIFASPGITPHAELLPELYWEIGALLPDVSGTVGYAATVNDDTEAGDVIRNAATFDSEIVGTRSPTVIHTVGLPYRAGVAHVSSAPGQTAGRVQPGDLITYTLTYTNPANSLPLVGAVLTDVLPGALSYVGSIGPIAPDPQLISQGILRWSLGALPVDTHGAVGFVARVVNDTLAAPDGGFIVNVAQLGSAGQRTVTSAPDVVEIRYRYDLRLSITDNQYQAHPGDLLTYTIHLTNVAVLPVTITGIVVNDYLEAGLPDYEVGGVLTCAAGCEGWTLAGEIDSMTIYSRTIDALGPNQSTAVTLVAQVSPTVRVDAPDVLAVGNFAEAFADGLHGVENDPTNQAGEDVTIVAGSDVLASQLRVSTSRPVPGRPFNVLVNVSNVGLETTLGPDDAGWFGVDVYVRPVGSPPPFGPADRYQGACPTPVDTCPATFRSSNYRFVKAYSLSGGGLAVGETWPLTYTLSLTSAGKYWLYVQADTFGSASPITLTGGTSVHGRLVEGNEDNNIIGPLEITVDFHRIYLPIVRR